MSTLRKSKTQRGISYARSACRQCGNTAVFSKAPATCAHCGATGSQRVTKRNPARKKTVKRRNPVKAISFRNFTGKVRLNPDKTVSVVGLGRKKKAAKKTAARKRTRTARRKR